MFEDRVDLLTCENILSENIDNVHLLGEIPLSDEDLELLAQLINHEISPSISIGTRNLMTNAPTCLIIFLVSMGRYYDKDRGYWPVVEDRIGPIDTSWQRKWGRFFINFLENNNLNKFDEEEGFTYVSPILGHVCIPDSCLPEYFERVLIPLLHRDLLNPFDREEIIHDLRARRKVNKQRLDLENSKKGINKKQKVIKQRLSLFKVLHDIVSLLEQEEILREETTRLGNLSDNLETREDLQSNLGDLLVKRQELEASEKDLEAEIQAFDKRSQIILNNEGSFKQLIDSEITIDAQERQTDEKGMSLISRIKDLWAMLSVVPWNIQINKQLKTIPFNQLSIQIEEYLNICEKKIKLGDEIRRIETTRIAPPIRIETQPKRESKFFKSIGKILIWLGRDKTSSKFVQWGNRLINVSKDQGEADGSHQGEPLGEYEQLNIHLVKIESEVQIRINNVREILSGLPINEDLIENPNLDLYHMIIELNEIYQELLFSSKERINLLKKKKQLQLEIRALASEAHIPAGGEIKNIISDFSHELQESHQRRDKAAQAEKIQDFDIQPELKLIQSEIESIENNLENINHELEDIGNGSLEEGSAKIDYYHQNITTVAKLRNELTSKYSEFSTYEEKIIKSGGWRKINNRLSKEEEDVSSEIEELNQKKKQVDRETRKIPIQYHGIDEPIRKFLLYGGSTAEDYQISSINLFANVQSGKKIEQIQNLAISQRIIIGFMRWWEYRKSILEIRGDIDEESVLATGERYRTPRIIFDRATADLLVSFPIQRCLRPENGDKVFLEVFGEDSKKPIEIFPLNLYNRPGDLFETRQPLVFPLIGPTQSCRFTFRNKESLIREWVINIFNHDFPLLAFHINSKKLISEESLPRAPLFVILHDGYAIEPQDCIVLVGKNLSGEWKDYYWYQIDLTDVEEFFLIDKNEKKIQVSLSSYRSLSCEIISGDFNKGILFDEYPVFMTPPGKIRIPADEPHDLSLMRISMLKGVTTGIGKVKHYQFSDLDEESEINFTEGWIDIPLISNRLLGNNPSGEYLFRVFNPPYLDWRSTFAIIPDINVTFEKSFYHPTEERSPSIIATLTIPNNFKFQPDKPAKVLGKSDKSVRLSTKVSEDDLTGMVEWLDEEAGKNAIPISILIPKIRWRIQGLSGLDDHWNDSLKGELWFGDLEDSLEVFLDVETPFNYEGKVSLILPGNSISIDSKSNSDLRVRFDLKAIEDRIRSGPIVDSVCLSLSDANNDTSKFSLFSFRTCWQAENIRCHTFAKGNKFIVDISWKEKGKSGEKIVRIWDASSEQADPVHEVKVGWNDKKAKLILDRSKLISGNYFIQIQQYDPWSPQPICPSSESLNTIFVNIQAEIPDEVVIIRKLWLDKTHSYPLPEGSYKIQIKGKVTNLQLPDDLDMENINRVVVTQGNEDWYVGKLEVRGVSEVVKYLKDTNYVKFDYDPEKKIITSIEDRYGDGAVYCYECRMLFWHLSTYLDEQKKKHPIYAPIERFDVHWDINK